VGLFLFGKPLDIVKIPWTMDDLARRGPWFWGRLYGVAELCSELALFSCFLRAVSVEFLLSRARPSGRGCGR